MLHVELNDKYDLSKQRVFLTGTQALVRLCLMQAARDRDAGLSTAGYVTGYRGSPLGGLDAQFPRAGKELAKANIVFEPGYNEELAATALWGTQQAELRGEGSYDGVFGIWYGKGPGVDRSGDVFRHANFAGSSKNGGVLVLTGDDHTCESSTTAHQSEYALMDANIPVLNPAGISDIIEFGLHGWALSRFAGVWCGLKLVKDNIESSGSIEAGFADVETRIPEFEMPEGGLNIRIQDTPIAQEARLQRYKLDAVRAYVAANDINRVIWGGPAKIGIVSTGKSYNDTMQALAGLGIDEHRAKELGVSLYKIGMPWPLEPTGLKSFARGLDLMIVVEEKRGLIEDQARAILYGQENAPQIIGKRDEHGVTLFQSEGALNPVQIAAAIGARIEDADIRAEAARSQSLLNADRSELSIARKPTFCAGCPHNSSTVVPDGSRAYAGIGCHFMVQWLDRDTTGFTQMGGEGANWIGEGKFSERGHVFQNIGDGTFNHSGIMSIRAAIGANVNMTFKLLYNDAVAMTGGQAHDGGRDVYSMADEIKAAGVKRLVYVTDDVTRVDTSRLPSGTKVHDRSQLQAVQSELSKVEGVTALIYDQTCAAEKRRRRKRGLFPDPPKRVVINEEVCEGCGDCGAKSNCVAILPLETKLGTKRQIDQSACNKDFSCVRGFCPSFVTVEGGEQRKPEPKAFETTEMPEPDLPDLSEPYAIALTGVGGTGVVTVGAILGMAAHIDGLGCGIIDMAGLAQKGGAVVSHLKFSKTPEEIKTIRIAHGGADLVLGCDMVVAASADLLATLSQDGATVVNSHEMTTSDFTSQPDFKLPVKSMHTRITQAVRDGRSTFVNATKIARELLGDTISANQFLLGVAFQKGLIPISSAAILRALELNGVAVELNHKAFQLGRQWAHDPKSFNELTPAPLIAEDLSMEEMIAHRVSLLTRYQSPRYARRFEKLIERVRAVDGEGELTRAVVHNAAKLMAYKDEYEVARLYTDGPFATKIEKMFEGDPTLKLHLAPPLLARKDPYTKEPLKREYGPWMFKLFGLLARMKVLRFTPFDPFGYTAERKMERRLIKEYESLVGGLLDAYDNNDYALAVELARLPEMARGFGHIKAANVEKMKQREATLRSQLKGSKPALAAE